jgi:hypothetical protein
MVMRGCKSHILVTSGRRICWERPAATSVSLVMKCREEQCRCNLTNSYEVKPDNNPISMGNM